MPSHQAIATRQFPTLPVRDATGMHKARLQLLPRAVRQGILAARAESSKAKEADQSNQTGAGGHLPPLSPKLVVGCLMIWAWPWFVGSLFHWTRMLKPFFREHWLGEVLIYGGTGLAVVSLARTKTPAEAQTASRHALWLLFQWLGYPKWLSEMLSLATFSFISGASNALLFFVGVNLCVNAIPDCWSMTMPAFLPEIFKRDLVSKRRVAAEDIELMVWRWSQHTLLAFLSSLFGYCLLQFKKAPKTPVPELEGLRCAEEKGEDQRSFSSLARLMYAKQNPLDNRARHLAQRMALPDRVLDSLVCVGLVLFPWTYLLGFRPQAVLAVGGVGGLAVGLAAKNVLGNLISGVLIQFNRPFGVGDEIEAEGAKVQGIVDRIGTLVTRVNSLDGVRVHVPNSRLQDGIVVNRTIKNFRLLRETMHVLARDMDALPSLVLRLQALLDAHAEVLQPNQLAKLQRRCRGKLKVFPPLCVFAGYGELGAKITIQASMRGSLSNTQFLKVKNALLLSVNECVQDSGFSIGFNCFVQSPPCLGFEGASQPLSAD